MKVGDVVAPKDPARPLMDDCTPYPHAVVCIVTPLILVSEDGKARWRRKQQHELDVIGQATPEVMTVCMDRLMRDHKAGRL